MSARDDYPLLTRSVSGVLYLSDEHLRAQQEGQRALDEIDRLRVLRRAVHTDRDPQGIGNDDIAIGWRACLSFLRTIA